MLSNKIILLVSIMFKFSKILNDKVNALNFQKIENILNRSSLINKHFNKFKDFPLIDYQILYIQHHLLKWSQHSIKSNTSRNTNTYLDFIHSILPKSIKSDILLHQILPYAIPLGSAINKLSLPYGDIDLAIVLLLPSTFLSDKCVDQHAIAPNRILHLAQLDQIRLLDLFYIYLISNLDRTDTQVLDAIGHTYLKTSISKNTISNWLTPVFNTMHPILKYTPSKGDLLYNIQAFEDLKQSSKYSELISTDHYSLINKTIYNYLYTKESDKSNDMSSNFNLFPYAYGLDICASINGCHNTYLISQYIQQNQFLIKLIKIVKLWAKYPNIMQCINDISAKKGCNDADKKFTDKMLLQFIFNTSKANIISSSQGMLTPYSLTLMVIYFCIKKQYIKPICEKQALDQFYTSYLPRYISFINGYFSALLCTDKLNTQPNPNPSPNHMHINEYDYILIFNEFIRYFSTEFNYKEEVVTIRHQDIEKMHTVKDNSKEYFHVNTWIEELLETVERKQMNYILGYRKLFIRDPYEEHRNLTRHIDLNKLLTVKDKFKNRLI